MVFSSEDRILIEQLHRSKGYGARKLVKEFPEKGWKVKFLQNAVCQKSLKSVNIWLSYFKTNKKESVFLGHSVYSNWKA